MLNLQPGELTNACVLLVRMQRDCTIGEAGIKVMRGYGLATTFSIDL
jgi:hypothetical protein